MTTNSEAAEAADTVAPTSYSIRSRESFQPSWWPLTVPVIVVPILATVVANDSSEAFAKLEDYYVEFYNNGDKSVAIASACFLVAVLLFIAFHLYNSTRSQTREVDLSLIVYPVGVQRCKRTTVIYNQDRNRQKVDEHHYPLLPIESVKDCILLEHVGGFSVSTHVMIRLQNSTTSSSDDKSTGKEKQRDGSESQETEDAVTGLVEAFPDANLTFDQCRGLVNQIRRALKAVQ